MSSTVCAIAGMLLFAAGAPAQDSPDYRLMEVLLEQGNLLQEQAARLQPVSAQLAAERKRLEGEERALKSEAAKVTQSFEQLNVIGDQLNAAMKQQQEECSGSSKFQSEVESCNTRAEELRGQAEKLKQQGAELDQQQTDVNRRIVQHNAAGREWNQRSTTHQAQLMPSLQQFQGWLTRFRNFLSSDIYPQFALAAGNPADCSSERVSDLDTRDMLPSLARALQCLKALKAASS